MSELALTFYGDDFTGSTDALEALTLGGVPSALFLEPPTPAQLAADFPHVRAVGVAGVARAMTPEQMDGALPPIFAALRELGAPICHYKVCSTFDSSPTIGSIGRALELGGAALAPAFVPLVVGAPALRRYVAFGNLFAGWGGEAVRLDRHPTMSRHPVTPMDESDLRRHLARQTSTPVGLVDLLQLAQGPEAIAARIAALRAAGAGAVLFDSIDDGHMLAIGRALWEQTAGGPLFVVGSSGVEYALTAWWRERGVFPPAAPFVPQGPAGQIVVMSGSASPVTAEQIAWAEANGFVGVRLDVDRLLEAEGGYDAELVGRAVAILGEGGSPLFYSARGPDDDALKAAGRGGEPMSERLAVAQGRVLRAILGRTGVRRICVAGGDTCGHVVRQLGIAAMTVLTPLAPGSPLCRAHAPQESLDGLQLALKGGQLGKADFFGRVRDGGP
jgi:uncharacterized protein YgbK (DUF1537 family)